MTRAERAADDPSAQAKKLHRALLGWYAACRRHLPWRRTRDPYAIWVSEIMLQQTRVDTVIPYFTRFLARFPTVGALADPETDDVRAAWGGLGYYRRARLLQAGAQAVEKAGGGVPSGRAALLEVPGVGRYTAGAVASIAFGEPVGVVDGNVARVLARLFALDDDMRKPAGLRRVQALADDIVATEDPGAWNQALMELGATVCTPRAPSCAACPAAELCRARALGLEASLPIMSEKRAPIAQRIQSLVVTKGPLVLLARRTAERFGGLWEPPSASGSTRVRTSLASAFPCGPVKRVATVEHVLTHRRLTVDVLRAELTGRVPSSPPAGYDALRLVDPAHGLARLGVATLTRKILRAAGLIDPTP